MYWLTDPYTLMELLTAVVGVLGLLLFWCLGKLSHIEEELLEARRALGFRKGRQRREDASCGRPEPMEVVDNHKEIPINWRRFLDE